MIILKSLIFEKYPEIIFGFSTKKGNNRIAPYFFNMSLSVKDDELKVLTDRRKFFNTLELKYENIAFQKQVHGANITLVNEGGIYNQSDALITSEKGVGLAISTADCTAIFIYDRKNKIISGVHSGWRGTEKKILQKVLNLLYDINKSKPEDLVVYLAPSISQKNYEVGKEVASLFNQKYLMCADNRYYLNVALANYDMLINSGVKKDNIQLSNLCSLENNDLLHSYRRDGVKSGRAFGVIALKDHYAE